MAKKTSPGRQKKEIILKELVDKLKGSCITILTDYRGDEAGLSVKDMNQLRKKLREANGECKIVKNTLIGLACKELKIETVDESLAKPTALILGYNDPVGIAKVIYDFAKERKTPTNSKGLPIIKIGYLDGKLIEESYVKAMAELPPKEILYAIVVRTVQAPISGFVNALGGMMRNLVYCLDNLKKKKAEA